MKHTKIETFRGRPEITIHDTEVAQPQALIAERLMSHLAIVAAMPDGEDSSGRQKLRMMTPAEVVTRANDIADLAWKQWRQRNWLLDIPDLEPEKPKADQP
jgi:hypothetical protein